MPRFPEVCRVGLVWSGNQDIFIRLKARGFGGFVKPQAVHVLQVKSQTTFLAIHLKADSVSAANSEAAGFECAQAAIGKMGHDRHSIVHLAPRGEGVLHGREFRNLPIEVKRHVDGMRK